MKKGFSKTLFVPLRKEIEQLDAEREKLIELSRKVIKTSKLVIYAVQRDSMHEAEKTLEKAKALYKKLPDDDSATGMISAARQEYVEACTFYYFLTEKKLLSPDELDVNTSDYLAGLCDLTGEVMRKGVNQVIKKKFDDVEYYYEFIHYLYKEFLNFSFRNGELRKKSDQIKWNLEKLEGIMYDLSLKERK